MRMRRSINPWSLRQKYRDVMPLLTKTIVSSTQACQYINVPAGRKNRSKITGIETAVLIQARILRLTVRGGFAHDRTQAPAMVSSEA